MTTSNLSRSSNTIVFNILKLNYYKINSRVLREKSNLKIDNIIKISKYNKELILNYLYIEKIFSYF